MTTPPPESNAPVAKERAATLYAHLLAEYGRGSSRVEVDFRRMLAGLGSAERLTHNLHPYPAKLLRHIPALFLSAPQVSAEGDLVLDPFCGSGTVLVEAQAANRSAIGIDTNPLACLISRAKTVHHDAAQLRQALVAIEHHRASARRSGVPERLRKWFPEATYADLLELGSRVAEVATNDDRDFFETCYSATVRRLSLADPRVSVPVRLNADRYRHGHWLRDRAERQLRDLHAADVMEEFRRSCEYGIARVETIESLGPQPVVVQGDARDIAGSLTADTFGKVQCIVTSPPYLSAQKYVRATSLSLMALGLAPGGRLQPLAASHVGREHFAKAEMRETVTTGLSEADSVIAEVRSEDPLRAHLAATYVNEMRAALAGMANALRSGGALVLIAGPNTLRGRPFPTPAYLRALAQQQGLVVELDLVDTIRSRGLMTRRNRSSAVIEHETVTIFRKP
jgi:SAM-dependent methyltransferase